MVGSWLVFPALLAALALGCGLLAEWLARTRLAGALLVPLGLAVLVVAGQLTTALDATAELTVPLSVALAVLGLVAGWRRRPGIRPDGWALSAAVTVYAVYGAPVLLSGEPTFAGYIRLDDTATWLAITDRVMEHGTTVDGLAPSTYEATLSFNLADGYPVGVFVPLGVGTALTGIDPAWLIQPYISLLAALLVPAIWALVQPLVRSRPLRALVAGISAMPALLVGYAQWGGVKEVAAAALLALAIALVAQAVGRRAPPRSLFPLGIAVAALAAVLSLGGLLWVLPALGAAGAVVAYRWGVRAAVTRTAWLAVAVGALSLPLLAAALLEGRVLPPTSASLAGGDARGNLVEPLGLDRLFGIWPAGDFRLDAVDGDVTGILIGVVAAAAALGWWWALRSGGRGLALYGAGTLAACGILLVAGSPWVDGKAMATAAPAVLALAAAGGAMAVGRGHRVEGGLVLAVVAAGVLWSNALAARDVSLAPRGQLEELERIGEVIAGEGPALMTEYQPYGARHFLRKADAEAASELRRRDVPLRGGGVVRKGSWADTDDLALDGLLVYRTLVLRRSPEQSRPPAPYELTWRGEHYDVWQRPALPPPPAIGRHLALGDGRDPGARASCVRARRLEARGAALAYSPAERPEVLHVDPIEVREARAELPVGGRWAVWVRGSVRGELTVAIDGRRIGSVSHALQNRGLYSEIGSARLDPGSHEVSFDHAGPHLLRPGSGGYQEPVGPVVLARDEAATRPVRVAERLASALCERRLDWIAAVGR